MGAKLSKSSGRSKMKQPEMARNNSNHLPTEGDEDVASSASVRSRKNPKPPKGPKERHDVPVEEDDEDVVSTASVRTTVSQRRDKGRHSKMDDSYAEVSGPSTYSSQLENQIPSQFENKYPTHFSQPENDYPIQDNPPPKNYYPTMNLQYENNYPVAAPYLIVAQNNYRALGQYDYPPFNYYPIPQGGHSIPDPQTTSADDFGAKLARQIFYGFES